jgi:serine O-acetyltransferase
VSPQRAHRCGNLARSGLPPAWGGPSDEDPETTPDPISTPTLEDEVVVYANATILGGETVIGRHSVIGSSVWLTHSVPPHTVVSLEKPSLRIKSPDMDGVAWYQI